MMLFSLRCCFLGISILLSAGGAYLVAQDQADITERQQDLLYKKWYDSQKNQSGIYNGRHYVDYTRLLKEGHVFFDSTATVPGAVRYNQVTHDNIPMLLDLVAEELIVQHFNGVFLIQLVKDKVEWFEINGHYFEHLGAEDGLSPGFYDKVYEGNALKLYVRRRKLIHEEIEHMQVQKIVLPEDRYYIHKDGEFHLVRSKASVMKLLGNKKRLGEALRAHKIQKFRAHRERAIKTMVEASDTWR